jgi:DNA-binding NarL/FixJ family response regulator
MSIPQKHIGAIVDTPSSHEGESNDSPKGERAFALLALSHTHVEQQLYRAMLTESAARESRTEAFSASRLIALTGIRSSSTVRRGLQGLLKKQSIERVLGEGVKRSLNGVSYMIYSPEEVFSRRREKGLIPFPNEIIEQSFDSTLLRVLDLPTLSRREAQVAIHCAEGLTNLEIAERLCVTAQTVKFHLRHVFIKFGIKRRTELIRRLLRQEAAATSAWDVEKERGAFI